MSSHAPPLSSSETDELPELRHNWCWFLALGATLIIVGLFALSYPVAMTLTTVEVFGYLFLCGAAIEIASGVWGRRWGGFFLHLLCGLMYLFLGVILIEKPALGAAGYTLLLAIFFFATGVGRVIFALSHRFHGRGWAVLSGVVALALGILIWRDLPESAFWVIGTFIGIELVFNGITWVMLGLAAHRIPAAAPGGRPVGV